LEVIQIAKATGLPLRRVRYVLEHDVLPGAEQASKGHRVTRDFTGFEAFGIALAALLLEGGLRRAVVARCVATLVATPVPARYPQGHCPLMYAYTLTGPSRLEVGDGVNLRLAAAPPRPGRPSLDTGWLQAATGAAVTGTYAPMVTVGVDVGRLRDHLRVYEKP
jgi:hypothetical protein